MKRNKNKRIETDAGQPRASEGPGFPRSFANRQSVHFVLLVLVGLAAYANTFHAPFQFDDVDQIEKNPIITTLDNFFSNTSGYDFNSRRFITYLTFALNYRLGGFGVAGYHLFNLAVHLANALLVYSLVLLSFKTVTRQGQPAPARASEAPTTEVRLIALFSALFFVAHPIQTQAVTYIYQRLTSLATLFYLLSVVAYIKARLAGEAPDKSASSVPGPRVLGFYLLSIAFALLAMKTKEIAFTLPLVILLYEFIFFRTGFKKKILIVLPLLLTLAVIPISMMGIHKPLGEILSDISERTRVQTDIPRGDYLLTQMRVVTTYVRLLFFPAGQNLDYDYPLSHSFLEPAVFFSFVFLSAIAGLGVYFLGRARGEALNSPQTAAWHYRFAAFGIFWFFMTLSVESSVIPIVDVIFEHRVYLPSVGAFAAITTSLFIAAAALKDKWPKSGAALAIALAVLVAALVAATFSRNLVWGDRLSLWQDVVRKSPAKGRGYNDLGNAYNRAGMLDKAIEAYQTALSLTPESYDAHNDLGIAYAKSNRIPEAIEEFSKAISIKPDYAKPYDNLGLVYILMNRIDKAIPEFSKSLELNPGNSDTWKNRGLAYLNINERQKAADDFKRACGLGNQESCEKFRQALQPGRP